MESSANIEEIDSITRKATVLVPKTYISKEFEESIKKYSQKVQIKGFRPGKAPRQMVEQMYGDSVRWDVISKAVSSSLEEVLKKHEIQMVGTPKIDITCSEVDKDLEYTADFSIYPTPQVANYTDVSVTVEKTAVTDKEIEDVMHSIRKNKATPKKVEDRDMVQADDVLDVTVKFLAKDGSETTPEDATLGLGDGRLPKEFDDQVIGMKIGETRTVTLPGNAESEEMTYEVTLRGISERELPELTDEFVEGLGGEEKTVAAMREKIQTNLEQQAESRADDKAKDEILNKLIEMNPFEVPQALVDDEIRNMLIRLGAVNTNNTKFDEIPAEPFRESLGVMALRNVKVSIILDQIANQEKIVPTEDDMKSAFQEIAADMRISEAEARRKYAGRMLLSLAVQVTRRLTDKFLRSKSKVEFTTAKSS